MAKIRKSREQKIKAELRHFDYHYEAPSTQRVKETIRIQPSRTQVSAYPYLKNDLLKTFVITGLILAFQSLFFILLKNNIISIPGINF